jgi:hypothetical protein
MFYFGNILLESHFNIYKIKIELYWFKKASNADVIFFTFKIVLHMCVWGIQRGRFGEGVAPTTCRKQGSQFSTWDHKLSKVQDFFAFAEPYM